MHLVSIIVLGAAAASLTLAALHLRMCFDRYRRAVNSLFVASAFSVAVWAFFEYLLMRAETPAEYGEILRWGHLAVWVVVVSTISFVRVYLRAGRPWLFWSVIVLRTMALVANFGAAVNLNYQEISALRQVNVLGETVSVVTGVPNPWMILGNASLVLFLIYCADAAIMIWKRGERQRALTIGLGVFVFSSASAIVAVSIFWGLVMLPLIASPFFLGIVFAMGYELTTDAQRSAQLAFELADSQTALIQSRDQLQLSAAAANVGIWERSFVDQTAWVNEKGRELLELSAVQFNSTEEVRSKIHPDDLFEAGEALRRACEGNGDYASEYRLLLKNGDVRWIYSQGKVEFDDGKPIRIRGALVDVTERKLAEMNLQNALAEVEQLRDQLLQENLYLKREIEHENNYHEIIGQSDELKYTLFKVEQVALTEATVLILGETGTGKELIARAIHKSSPRADRPLIKINCATLPANLIESELFGHERGAFTGANATKIGRFEVAHGATLFLDEIGELPLELQPKLLRVLQEGEFERLGSNRTIKVDVRIIAATNRNLTDEIKKGQFRDDLWYRLNVFPITVPPLRQREGDVRLLLDHFVSVFNRKLGKDVTNISPALLDALESYAWPGNVRELANVVERAVISGNGTSLQLADKLDLDPWKDESNGSETSLLEVERMHILHVLQSCSWKIEGAQGAARKLGLVPSTLRSRMVKLDIHRHNDPPIRNEMSHNGDS